MGTHDEQPQDTSQALAGSPKTGLVNIVAGCCGTTPEHVRAITAAPGVNPETCPRKARGWITALAAWSRPIFPESNFVMVGERTTSRARAASGG